MLLECWIVCSRLLVGEGVPPSRFRAGGDYFGRCVASIGDIDGDDVADLVVGAPGQRDLASGACHAMFAFSGRTGAVLYTVWGEARADVFVHTDDQGSIADLGDVNGDGVHDFAETITGAAIRSGRGGAVLVSIPQSPTASRMRRQCAAVGDVDRDGIPDVAIADGGADDERGVVRIHSGVGGTLVRTLRGEPGDRFGVAIDAAIDWNGDGIRDVLVGVPRRGEPWDVPSSSIGLARVVSLATGATLLEVSGERAGDCFGYGVAWIGDVNGDGKPDFAVGAPDHGNVDATPKTGPGRVRVFSGADGAVLHAIDGVGSAERPGSLFGRFLARAGDVDGDRTIDLIVGAPREGMLRGSARVYSGRTSAVLHEFVGPVSTDWGACVGTTGDWNGDSQPELVVTALNDTLGATPIGEVLVFDGKSGRELRRLRSPLTPPR